MHTICPKTVTGTAPTGCKARSFHNESPQFPHCKECGGAWVFCDDDLLETLSGAVADELGHCETDGDYVEGVCQVCEPRIKA